MVRKDPKIMITVEDYHPKKTAKYSPTVDASVQEILPYVVAEPQSTNYPDYIDKYNAELTFNSTYGVKCTAVSATNAPGMCMMNTARKRCHEGRKYEFKMLTAASKPLDLVLYVEWYNNKNVLIDTTFFNAVNVGTKLTTLKGIATALPTATGFRVGIIDNSSVQVGDYFYWKKCSVHELR